MITHYVVWVFVIAILSYVIGTVQANDVNCAEGIHAPVQCYECSTRQPDSQFCADPFNRSHPSVKTAVCNGPCSKLVQRPQNGPSHYVRTCSNNLNHRLTLSLVCMKESPPGDGRLCFCHRPLCNSAAAADVWHRPPFAFVPPATPLMLLPPLLLTLRHAMVTVAMDATSGD